MVFIMSLTTALKRVLPFFAPENLAKTKIDYAPKEGETALLIIDVQRAYCAPFGPRGTMKTRQISNNIKRLTPAFRAAGVATYVVYYDETEKPLREVDFYKVKPGPQDIAVRKYTDSAFRSGKLRLTVPEVETKLRPSTADAKKSELLLRLQIPQGKSSLEFIYELLAK